MTRIKCILLMIYLACSILAGCGKDEVVEEATDNAIVNHVDYSVLTEENLERGLKSAYNDASLGTKWNCYWDSFGQGREGRYKSFEKLDPAAVRQAQLEDYYSFSMNADDKSKVEKDAAVSSLRTKFISNIGTIIIITVGVIVLLIIISMLNRGKIERDRKPLAVPMPRSNGESRGSTEPESIDRFSVNYAKGLKTYCHNHSLDYDKVVHEYSDAEKAFKSLTTGSIPRSNDENDTADTSVVVTPRLEESDVVVEATEVTDVDADEVGEK